MKNIHFLIIVVALTALSIFLYMRVPYQLGLDIEGGVRLVYRMKTEELDPDDRQNLDVLRGRMQKILESRVAKGLGVVEGNVIAKIPDQFIVELPGMSDINEARAVLSTTASIRLYHATTVSTSRVNRAFSVGDAEDSETGSPQVTFIRRDGSRVEPGTPEYREMIDGWTLILEGGDLARASFRQSARGYQPEMFFNREGAEKLESWSRRNRNRGEHLAFVLDGVVLSIAPLREGTVLSDNAYIDGTFETEYVRSLVDLLNAGALPISLEELSSQQVDPTIGRGALDKILFAGQIAFGLIALFLILYYAFPGFIAAIALVLYALFTLTALKSLGATFSLAAIAGFVLSVGMAVDANVLVFERLKEELRQGKTLWKAVDLGFKRALPAIVDSNACTILTSLVLYTFGDGPVKGFATTLIIGVAISLFTAVTVTRSLLFLFSTTGIGNNLKNYALNRNLFGESRGLQAEENPIKVMAKRRTYFLISGAMMAAGLVFVAIGGIKPNVEFMGGVRADVVVRQSDNVQVRDVQRSLEAAGIRGGIVTIASAPVEGEKMVSVTVPESDAFQMDDPASEARIVEASGLNPLRPAAVSKVGPVVRDETIRNAINGVLYGTLLILIYLAIRFGLGMGGMRVGFRFGLATLAALIHDVVIVIGFAGIMGFLFNWQISALFITAMLTVAGFSTHDSIVIFDRIRENLRRNKLNRDFATIIDISVTQSIARSINTSFTVIIALGLLLTIGATTVELSFFNAVMLVGVIVGTYSSIFNAAPVLFLYDMFVTKRKGEGDSLVAHTQAEMLAARQVAAAPEVAREERVYRDEQGNVYGQVKRRDTTGRKRPGTVDLDED